MIRSRHFDLRFRFAFALLALLLVLAAGAAGGLSAQSQTYELYSSAPESASGTGTTPGFPLNTYYHDQRMECLYPSSVLLASGLYAGAKITQLQLKCAVAPGRDVINLRIRLKEAGPTISTLGAFSSPTPGADIGLSVAYGPSTITVAQCVPGQWVPMTLSEPFTWNGVSGLNVDIFSDGETYVPGGAVYMRTTPNTQSFRIFADGMSYPAIGNQWISPIAAAAVWSLRVVAQPASTVSSNFYADNPSVGFGGGTGGFATPFSNAAGRQEAIYPASELSAIGCYAGASISSIAVRVIWTEQLTSSVPTVVPNVRIRMGHTLTSSYSFTNPVFTPAATGNLTTVYGPASFSRPSLPEYRWIDLALTTPFVWNGTSNLLVDISCEGAAQQLGYLFGQRSPLNSSTTFSVGGAGTGLWPYDSTSSGSLRAASPPDIRLTFPAPPAPAITVKRTAATIADAGSDVLSVSLAAGTASPLSYTVANTGGIGSLNVTGVTVTGASNCTASLATGLAGPLPPQATGTLQFSVTPAAIGAWSFLVTVANNSVLASTQSYTFTVSGFAAAAGTTVAEMYPTAAETNSSGAAGYPFNTNAQKQRMEFIYEASELLEGGLSASSAITQLQFKVLQVPGLPLENFRIRLGHAPGSTVSTTAFTSAASGILSLAYGPVTVPTSQFTAGQWTSFTLTTPFAWNGTSNLLVDISCDSANSALGGGIFMRAAPGVQSLRGSGSSGTWPFDAGLTSMTSEAKVPAMRIGYGAATPPPPAFKAQDVNHSSAVNVQDVQLTVNIILSVATPAFTGQGDVNNSGTVTVADVQSIVNCILNAASCP
jgi:hypothetical protein